MKTELEKQAETAKTAKLRQSVAAKVSGFGRNKIRNGYWGCRPGSLLVSEEAGKMEPHSTSIISDFDTITFNR